MKGTVCRSHQRDDSPADRRAPHSCQQPSALNPQHHHVRNTTMIYDDNPSPHLRNHAAHIFMRGAHTAHIPTHSNHRMHLGTWVSRSPGKKPYCDTVSCNAAGPLTRHTLGQQVGSCAVAGVDEQSQAKANELGEGQAGGQEAVPVVTHAGTWSSSSALALY